MKYYVYIPLYDVFIHIADNMSGIHFTSRMDEARVFSSRKTAEEVRLEWASKLSTMDVYTVTSETVELMKVMNS